MAELSIESGDRPDRRSEDRQNMIIRAGLLNQAGIPFYYSVRNVSSTSFQVKLSTSTARIGDVVMCIADENPIAGQIVRINNSRAAISFDGNIDPDTVLCLQQKMSPVKRRAIPRVKQRHTPLFLQVVAPSKQCLKMSLEWG